MGFLTFSALDVASLTIVLDRQLMHALSLHHGVITLEFSVPSTLSGVFRLLGLRESLVSVAVCGGKIIRADQALEPGSTVGIFGIHDGG